MPEAKMDELVSQNKLLTAKVTQSEKSLANAVRTIDDLKAELQQLRVQITTTQTIASQPKTKQQQQPKKRGNRKRELSPEGPDSPVQCKNKFAALAFEENGDDMETSDSKSSQAGTSSQSSQPKILRQEAATDSQAEPSKQSTTTQPAKQKIPPIHIRTKEGWTKIQQQLKASSVTITSAKNLQNSIEVKTDSATSFRAAITLLDETQVPYHTYALPEDKLVKAVIKGIPEGVSEEEVRQALLEINLPVTQVKRMKSLRTKSELPMMLVQLQKPTGTKIFDLKRLLHLVVAVEPQRRRKEVGQCFRCQSFGHSARCCRAGPKCVKCGAAHFSYACLKLRTEKATCANCQGDHPANYRGCPRYPKPQTKKTTTDGQSPAVAPNTVRANPTPAALIDVQANIKETACNPLMSLMSMMNLDASMKIISEAAQKLLTAKSSWEKLEVMFTTARLLSNDSQN